MMDAGEEGLGVYSWGELGGALWQGYISVVISALWSMIFLIAGWAKVELFVAVGHYSG